VKNLPRNLLKKTLLPKLQWKLLQLKRHPRRRPKPKKLQWKLPLSNPQRLLL
jgi:hypothetical protein